MARRRALLEVEYGTESAKPLDADMWEAMLKQFANLQTPVRVEVLEDESAV